MPTLDLLMRLLPKQRQGSKPRCHLLTHGDGADVAKRLTALIAPFGKVSPADSWLPRGFDNTLEAKLGETPELLSGERREQVSQWWLEVRENANTPNWDIASTCDIEGQKGLILMEAKAHSKELSGAGKEKPKTVNSSKNHEKIGKAIAEANISLNRVIKGWNLSRDSHYQLSNRFAWTWKLASLGMPVILVYLGFLNADEMHNHGESFKSPQEWEQAICMHASGVVPDQVWNGAALNIGGAALRAIIRSEQMELPSLKRLGGAQDGSY